MSQNVFIDLGTVDAQENGDAKDISCLKPGTVNVAVSCSTSPAWNGTWALQIANNDDMDEWVTAPTSDGGVTGTSTGSKAYHLPGSARAMRLICSSYTAGSASAWVSGEKL